MMPSMDDVVIDIPIDVYESPKWIDTCYYAICICILSVLLCIVVVLLIGLAIEEQSFGAYLGLGMFVVCMLFGVLKCHFGG